MFETLETRQLFCALPYSSANGDGTAIGMEGITVSAEREISPADVTSAAGMTTSSASHAEVSASDPSGAD